MIVTSVAQHAPLLTISTGVVLEMRRRGRFGRCAKLSSTQMFGRTQRQPRFWKALLATLIFSVPLALFLRALVHMTDLVWFVLTIGMTLAIASIIHSRTIFDWRASDTMHLQDFEKRNATPSRSAARRSHPAPRR
jgi:hypothetical protein